MVAPLWSARLRNRERWSAAVAVLWAGYLVVFPFHRVWELPWLGRKFQPPEVVFLALVVAAAAIWKSRRAPWRFTLADGAAAGWLLANLLALAWPNEPTGRAGFIEVVGSAYVVCLYVVVRITATPWLLDRFGEWFARAAAIPAALGIAGSVASYAGMPNSWATVVALTPVPYIGDAARAHAYTAGPQMLASILLLAVPLLIAARMQRGWRRSDLALGLLLVLGLGATLSKTALCLPVALIVMWACVAPAAQPASLARRCSRIWAPVLVASAVTVLFAVGSHVMLLREAAVTRSSVAQLVGGSPLASFRWRGEPWVVMPTSYLFNKRASLQAIERSWPAGLGPAGQPRFTARLQQQGSFPKTIGFITPHSTYLGVAAELGVVGLGALLLILLSGGVAITRLLAASPGRRWEPAAYAGIAAAFLIEATSTDLLNCRHYWFLFAVIAARHAASHAGAYEPSDLVAK